jgi:hypothetical protein
MFYTFVIFTVLIIQSDLCDVKWQVTSSENKPRVKYARYTERSRVTDKEISPSESCDKTEQVSTDTKYAYEINGFQNLTKPKRSKQQTPFILYSKSYSVLLYVLHKNYVWSSHFHNQLKNIYMYPRNMT